VRLFVHRGRRDPYWGLDGPAARSSRRRHRFTASLVILLSGAILILILARLPSVNAATLLTGPSRLLVLASLAGDTVACCLVFARDLRRRRAMQEFGELPVTNA
jgi:hypothetical protein